MADDWATQVAQELEVGTPGGAETIITSTVPDILVTYYAGIGITVSGTAELMYPGDGSYYYKVVGFNHVTGNDAFELEGFVNKTQTTVYPTVDRDLFYGPGLISSTFGNLNGPGSTFMAGDFTFGGGAAGPASGTNPDYYFDGVGQAHGLLAMVQLAGSPVVTALGGGAEVGIATFNGVVFLPDRVYEVKYHGPVSATAAAGRGLFRVRRGAGVGGAQLLQWSYPPTPVLGEVTYNAYIASPVGGVTESVTLTLQALAGSDISIFATGAGQGQWAILDVGSTAQQNNWDAGIPTW